MSEEFTKRELVFLRSYTKAIAKHWWAILTGLVLTVLDGIERMFGAWYLPPRWAKVSTAIAGLVLAQYLAYRDIASHVADVGAEFRQKLRQVFRNVELQWSILNQPDAHVTAQTICRRVDEFRADLEQLYGQCPPETDSQHMREAIEKLHATAKYRVGNLIGSQQSMDRVCEQMESALAEIRSMLGDKQ